MKIIDQTPKGITEEQLKAVKTCLGFVDFENKENGFICKGLQVTYWLHTIPNVQEDTIKVARVSCI